MTIFFLIILLIIVIIIFSGMLKLNNALNPLFHSAEATKANIKILMQKRLSIIIQLTELANKYAGHERDIHVSVSNDKTIKDAMVYVSTRATHFPDLKADATYIRLMNEFTSLANEVQSKFETYNNVIREYNTKRQQWFQSLCLAIMGGFPALDYLDATTWTFVDPPTITIKQIGGYQEKNYETIG